MDFNKRTYTKEIGGRTLTVEYSDMAKQANAAVTVQYGETVVLGTAVMSDKEKDLPFFPLRVDYEERFYARGQILGSRFMRREGRPSEEAVLTGRLIDRTIRPLFDHRMRRDVQVIITVLSYDEENDPAFPSMVAASLALASSNIPWDGPVAGISLARHSGDTIVLPTQEQVQNDVDFELFASGPEGRIGMIELGGDEADEADVASGLKEAQERIDEVIAFQKEILAEEAQEKEEISFDELPSEVAEHVKAFLDEKIEETMAPSSNDGLSKQEYMVRKEELMDGLASLLKDELGEEEAPEHMPFVEEYFEKEVEALLSRVAVERGLRIDGRAPETVRDLYSEVGLFPRTHGSALFARGDTQALAVTTIAPPGAEKLIEGMETEEKRRFMLHYNFPPFSVGEVKPLFSAGRREIGHGALAMKAIERMLPPKDEFPYTLRVVSEILSSNGSSSMATVCSASLSLMDAGVPMKRPVAGIAMGMMSTDDDYTILTDIQGPEDHYGEMDFKVAGTEEGITAIQLDVKVRGLTEEMIAKTLEQAKEARLHILSAMGETLAVPREELSPRAPAVLYHQIDPSQIGTIIGPGGKTINGMIEEYELASIDVDDDGSVFVSAPNRKNAEAALEEIKLLTRELKVGEEFEGPVVRTLDFGAIVDLGGGRDGMIHVSELGEGFVENVTDVVKEGDMVKVKVKKVEGGGSKIGLSLVEKL